MAKIRFQPSAPQARRDRFSINDPGGKPMFRVNNNWKNILNYSKLKKRNQVADARVTLLLIFTKHIISVMQLELTSE